MIGHLRNDRKWDGRATRGHRSDSNLVKKLMIVGREGRYKKVELWNSNFTLMVEDTIFFSSCT